MRNLVMPILAAVLRDFLKVADYRRHPVRVGHGNPVIAAHLLERQLYAEVGYDSDSRNLVLAVLVLQVFVNHPLVDVGKVEVDRLNVGKTTERRLPNFLYFSSRHLEPPPLFLLANLFPTLNWSLHFSIAHFDTPKCSAIWT